VRRDRAPVLLAYATFVLVGVSAGVSGVLLPAQIADYGVDKATIGLTFFTFSAGYLLAGATVGTLVERFGIRLALLTGGLLYMLSALCLGLRPPFVAFVAVQVVAGYAMGSLEAVLNACLAGLPSATTLLNRLHGFFGVGAVLGPLLATWLLGLWPWTAVWVVLALMCLPLMAGFVVAYPRRDGGIRHRAAAGSGLLPAVLRSQAVLLACVFLAVYVGLETSVGTWGFTYLVEEHARSEPAAGYAISGYWLGLTAGRFLISPIAARLGMTTIGMSFACLGGVTAAVLLIWPAPVAPVGLALLGFFLGPLFPTALAVMPRLTEARLLPTAIGVLSGMSVVGDAGFSWLAGAIAQGAGAWTLVPFVLVCAVAQLAVWRLIVGRMSTAEAQGRH